MFRPLPIADSATANLPLGADMTAPAAPISQLVISNRVDESFNSANMINLAELRLWKTDGTVYVPPLADLSASSVSTSLNELIDNNFRTFYQSRSNGTHTGEANREQFIWVRLPTTAGFSVSRIELINRYDKCCMGRMASLIVSLTLNGQNILDTAFRGQHSNVTIFVPQNGVYPSNVLVRDATTHNIFWVENNQLRPVSDELYINSGYPSYADVVDWNFLSLPEGAPMESLPNAIPNYIAFFKEAKSFTFDIEHILEMADLSLVYESGASVPLKADDIFMSSNDEIGTHGRLIDGSTTTLCETRRKGNNDEENRSDQYIRVKLAHPPSSSSRIKTVIIKSTSKAHRFVGVKMTVKFGSQFFETRFTNEQSTYNVDLLSIATVSASSTLPSSRQYPTLLGGSFPTARSVSREGTFEQCPQICDYTPGCVGFTTNEAAGSGCKLLFPPLGLPSATIDRTFIAVDASTSITDNSAIQAAKIYRYVDGFSIGASDTAVTVSDVSTCADLCNQDSLCIGYTFKKFDPNTCWFKRSVAGVNNLDPTMEGYAALTPVKYTCASTTDSLGHMLKLLNPFGVPASVEGEDQFLAMSGYDLDGLFFSYMPRGQFTKRLCREIATNKVVLAVPSDAFACNWHVNFNALTKKFSIRSDFQDEEPVYLISSGIGRGTFALGYNAEEFIPVKMPLFKEKRPYMPAIPFVFEGGVDLFTYRGPVTRCADICDAYEECRGYTIFAGWNGCTLKSDVGTQTDIPSAAKTVKVYPFTTELSSDGLPWQNMQSLVGGRARTPFTGMGVHIHILDSGISDYYGERGFYRDFIHPVNGSNWADDVGHADVIAKIFRGVHGIVPGASIHSSKIFNSLGQTSPRAFVQAMADVIQKATDNYNSHLATRPTIVSLSLLFPDTAAVKCIAQLAYSKNIFLVAGAGNDRADAGLYSPANSGYALVVGAYGADKKLSATNIGPSIDIFAASGKYPHPSKPGMVVQGTSLAAPHVSAVLGKMLWERPEFQILPPIYAYNAIRWTGVKNYVLDAPAGTTNRALSGKTQFASSFTAARPSFTSPNHCGTLSTVKDVISSASTSLTGKGIANALSASADPYGPTPVEDTENFF